MSSCWPASPCLLNMLTCLKSINPAQVVSSACISMHLNAVGGPIPPLARTGLRFMPDTEVDALVAEIEAEKAAAEAARRGQAAGS